MIGKLLATMSTVEEDRVLCTVMRPGSYRLSDKYNWGPCLIGTMMGKLLMRSPLDRKRFGPPLGVDTNIEGRYDFLCKRFGVAKINTLIRNRILANRVKKVLKEVKHEQAAIAECY